MIPRVRPSYSWDDLWAAARAQPSTPEIFENALASFFRVKYAIAFPYGRSAIYSFLKALNLTGSEVVQPAYNCVVVAHATMSAGCLPVFVDAQENDPNPSNAAIMDKVTEKTSVVIPTSIFGVAFDAESLLGEIRKKNPRALVVMDCAQAFNAVWQGKLLAGQGDAAVLAFGIGKPMTTLYGGALLTNRDDIFSKVRKYRDENFYRSSSRATLQRWLYYLASWVALSDRFVAFTDWFEHAHTPLHSYLQTLRAREAIRMPSDNQMFMRPMEAAIGLTQLQRVAGFMQRRREIAAIYARELSGLDALKLLDWSQGSTYAIYAARLMNPTRREQILEVLARQGVQGDTVLNYVVPGLDCYREQGFSAEPFPNSIAWSQSVVNLPNHPTMTDRQIWHVAGVVKQILGNVYE